MKLKSLLSLLLCFLLVATPVLANTESESMQRTLAHAKTILTIPEEYSEFSYHSQTDADGTVYWTFRWSGEQKGNVEATFSEDGVLASYYAWVYTESYDDSLANYTHDDAKNIAKEFVQQVNPQVYPNLLEDTPDGENRDSRTAFFTFREYRNGIPSFANTVSVTVDKYHGIVRNYQSTKRIEDFLESETKLTEDEAKELYLRDIGIRMEYRMYYDYRTKTYKVFPVYSLKDTTGKAICAVTGEMIEPYFPESFLFRLYNGAMSDMAMKEQAAGVQFTPEELAALSNVSEVFSKEDIKKLAKEKIPALKDYTLRSASLQRDYRDETKLFWYLDFQKDGDGYRAGVQMDAKTGQLLGFSLPQNGIENKTFTKEDAKKVAKAFLEKEAADVFAKTEYTEEVNSYVPLAKEGTLPNSYEITYQRMENGIPVSGNYLTVRVDADTKQIGSYTRSFTEGLSFPDLSTCLSEAEIFEIMDEKMNFLLTYLPTKEGNKLAYTFLHPEGQLFDPYTGKLLNYDGTHLQEAFVPQYTDIHGHWAEDMIVTLLDNGYYFSENEFRPDAAITKKEFLQFFRMIGNDTDEELNKFIAKLEEIPVEEADINAVMTKETISKYFIYYLGYQKIAAVDEMFLYPFPDGEEVDASLKGDITILTGLGIFKGSSDGHFYPKKQLTRAEAVSCVYNFLATAP